MKIKEIIVVEGRDDTARVKEAVDCDTFETNGSAINKKKIDRLKLLEKNRGIIVFTDPDYSGKRIRNIIQREIPSAKQAYISNKKAIDKKGKIGIEAASIEDIRIALKKCYTPNFDVKEEITQDILLELGLVGDAKSKILREFICEELNIEYTNGKQLKNKLNMYSISKKTLINIVEKVKDNCINDRNS